MMVYIQYSNILHQIEKLEKSQNYEYIKLLQELELYNIYNIQLEDYNNYIHNSDIYKQIEQNKNIINDYNEIQLIKDTINNINNNELNDDKYNLLCNTIDKLVNEINNKKNKHSDNIKQYNDLIDKQSKYININNKIIELEKEQYIFKTIIELTGIDGIPRKIINIKLSHVETEINNLLKPFFDKKLIIKTETIVDKQKNKNININVFFDDNKNKTNLLGGFESFLILLAFKITLSNFFSVPYCGILIIDEGVSVLDRSNVDKFNIIAEFIKKYYNNIILISHIPSFNDYIDTFIKIDKNKDKSSKIIF